MDVRHQVPKANMGRGGDCGVGGPHYFREQSTPLVYSRMVLTMLHNPYEDPTLLYSMAGQHQETSASDP